MIAHVVEAGVAAIDPVLALHGAHTTAHGLDHLDRALDPQGVVLGEGKGHAVAAARRRHEFRESLDDSAVDGAADVLPFYP